MKKLLLASAALLALGTVTASAADLPMKAPVYKAPPPPVFSWTGLYIGAHIGGGWGDKALFEVPSGAQMGSGNISGILGGVQAGYNYQVNPWLVLGIEGDFSWADVNGSFPIAIPGSASASFNAKADWFATLTGRIGTTVFDRSLLYLKGGAAWVHDKYAATGTCVGAPGPEIPGAQGDLNQPDDCEAGPFTADTTNLGWTIGVGWEYAFDRNWSAKLEYDFMDFGTQRTTFTDPDGDAGTADVRQRVHAVKFGVNYRFDWLH